MFKVFPPLPRAAIKADLEGLLAVAGSGKLPGSGHRRKQLAAHLAYVGRELSSVAALDLQSTQAGKPRVAYPAITAF